MNGHGPEDPKGRENAAFQSAVRVAEIEPEEKRENVLFDFSRLDNMRVQDLTILLTARSVALENERTVWAAGVPLHMWRTLRAMGLGDVFKHFPSFGDGEEV